MFFAPATGVPLPHLKEPPFDFGVFVFLFPPDKGEICIHIKKTEYQWFYILMFASLMWSRLLKPDFMGRVFLGGRGRFRFLE